MKILRTNWINLLLVFTAVLLYSVVVNLFETNVSRNVFQAVVAALILICLYGLMFWGLFALSLLVLDSLLIVKDQTNLKVKLLIEWAVISIPFLYWIIKYQEWIFAIAIIAFLAGQLIREKSIQKAIA